ncbi:MAG TPA: alpha/beta hydrolase [Microthrixaceae bacterium]|nr:alpha/beta hydrolase [Microthrixaceae bacterium]
MGRARSVAALSIVVLVLGACATTPSTPPNNAEQFVEYEQVLQVGQRLNHQYGPHAQHRFDLWRPADSNDAPVVVFVHGGFWKDEPATHNRGAIPEAVKDLLHHGYAVASISYRGVDFPVDAVHPDAIQDVKRAVAYLHGNRFLFHIGSEVHLIGYSAGGHLALMAAMTYGDATMTPAVGEVRVESVVSVAGPTDIPALAAIVDDLTLTRIGALNDYVCGSPAAPCYVNPGLSPMGHVSADDPPALLIYGSADTLVPPSQGEELEEALHGVGVTAAFGTLPFDHPGIQHQLNTTQLAAWMATPSD